MQPIQAISSVPNPPPELKGVTHLSESDKAKLWQASQGLESTFTVFLMKDLKLGPTDDNGKQTFAADTYGDMFKQAIADQMARSDTRGLARQIYVDSATTAEKSMTASHSHPVGGPSNAPLSSAKKMPMHQLPVVPNAALLIPSPTPAILSINELAPPPSA